MNYIYKLNTYNHFKIPKRNLFIQELFNNKIIYTWSMEEIELREQYPWDEKEEQESFIRCTEWLQENYPELLI